MKPSNTILDRFLWIHQAYEDGVDTIDTFNENSVNTLIQCHKDRQGDYPENLWNEFRDCLPVYESSLKHPDPAIIHTIRLIINRAESEWIRLQQAFSQQCDDRMFDDDEE